MANLTSFEYWTSYAWEGEPFDPARVGAMLRERCPNLQVRMRHLTLGTQAPLVNANDL